MESTPARQPAQTTAAKPQAADGAAVALPARPAAAAAQPKAQPAASVEDIDTAFLATPVRKGARKEANTSNDNSPAKSPQSNLNKSKSSEIGSDEDSVDILPVSNPAQEERVNFRNFS